jgi:hypothetical protein
VAENIDLVRLEALNEYWTGHPPVHAMIAAYFGIKPKATPADLENQDFSGLFALGNFVEGPVI